MQEQIAIQSKPKARMVGYVILILATLIGLWALWQRFSQGLIITNLTQYVPWGFWVSFYIYFIGLSAGSFLLSTLVYVFGIKRFEAVGPLALIQALLCMLLGMVLVFVDLGHPARFFNVFIYWNHTSILAWECLFYTIYIVIILVELVLVYKPPARSAETIRRWLKIMGLIGIPVAIGVHGGTGAIFAVVKSQPHWYTGLFPIVFLISALASGGALLTFLTAFIMPLEKEEKLTLTQSLAKLTVGIIAFDLLLVCSEMIVTFYGGIPHHINSWKQILFGPFWWVFWFVQIIFGVLVPIGILLRRKTRESVNWLGTLGLLVVLGVVGVRLNIVIPPLLDPQFDNLPNAYYHSRYALGYFPSLNEWLVSLGIVAIGVWFFLLTLKLIFPAVPSSKSSDKKGV